MSEQKTPPYKALGTEELELTVQTLSSDDTVEDRAVTPDSPPGSAPRQILTVGPPLVPSVSTAPTSTTDHNSDPSSVIPAWLIPSLLDFDNLNINDEEKDKGNATSAPRVISPASTSRPLNQTIEASSDTVKTMFTPSPATARINRGTHYYSSLPRVQAASIALNRALLFDEDPSIVAARVKKAQRGEDCKGSNEAKLKAEEKGKAKEEVKKEVKEEDKKESADKEIGESVGYLTDENRGNAEGKKEVGKSGVKRKRQRQKAKPMRKLMAEESLAKRLRDEANTSDGAD
ncbi:hypothetical protein MMC24_000645 [Lignoscripta atroalba]|nr:hypothetical protein [Lignoscripta atroalba]